MRRGISGRLRGVGAAMVAALLLIGGAPPPGGDDTINLTVSSSTTREELDRFIATYSQAKQPMAVPIVIGRARALKLFEGGSLPPLLGFVTGYFAEAPERIPVTLDALQSLPVRDRQAVLAAAVLASKTGAAQEALLARLDADGLWLIQALSKAGIHGSEAVAPVSPSALDFMWGEFLATGDARRVLPIVSVT